PRRQRGPHAARDALSVEPVMAQDLVVGAAHGDALDGDLLDAGHEPGPVADQRLDDGRALPARRVVVVQREHRLGAREVGQQGSTSAMPGIAPSAEMSRTDWCEWPGPPGTRPASEPT